MFPLLAYLLAIESTMFKHTCTNLTTLSIQRVRQWLNGFETVICDADGVLWHFDKAIDGSVEAFNAIQDTGRNTFIVTNNSCMCSESIRQKARKFGFKVQKDHVLNSGKSVANFLSSKNFQEKVYVVGGQGILDELANVNICAFQFPNEKIETSMNDFALKMKIDQEVGAVVVGRDDKFNMCSVIRASYYLRNPQTLFLGCCLDAAYPIGNDRVLAGAAAMIASVKTVSARKPLILGKPNPWIVRGPIESGFINPATTLMVGDTLETDIKFANYNGFQSILVGSGVTELQKVERIRDRGHEKHMRLVPDAYLPSLCDILEYL